MDVKRDKYVIIAIIAIVVIALIFLLYLVSSATAKTPVKSNETADIKGDIHVSNAKGKNQSIRYTLYDPETKNAVKDSSNSGKNIKAKKYHAVIEFTDRAFPISNITIFNISIENETLTLYAEDSNETQIKNPSNNKWNKVYSIDTGSAKFDYAEVYSKPAQGHSLFKCKEWNFTAQKCSGRWQKIADLELNKPYSFFLTPGDPGVGESNNKVNIMNKNNELLEYNETHTQKNNALFDINVTILENASVKNIEVKNHDNKSQKHDLLISPDGKNESERVEQITSIDSTNLNFTEIVIELEKPENATKAFICEDWSDESEKCSGRWKKHAEVVNISNDTYLVVQSTPGRSAYGHSADEVILLDKNYQLIKYNYKVIEKRNETVDIETQLSAIRPDNIKVYYKKKNVTANELRIEYNSTKNLYAIDPENLEAEYAEVSATASGRDLFKCANWSFSSQECFGYWVKMQDIVPGKSYLFNLTKTDPGFQETSNVITLIDKNNVLASYNETILSNNSGILDVFLSSSNWSNLKSITIKGHNSKSADNDLKLEPQTNLSGFNQSYAVDASEVNASSILITFEAKASMLWKCADWNFTAQQCKGTWIQFMNLTKGEIYTIIINPEDPGFGENDTQQQSSKKGIFVNAGGGSISRDKNTAKDGIITIKPRINAGVPSSLNKKGEEMAENELLIKIQQAEDAISKMKEQKFNTQIIEQFFEQAKQEMLDGNIEKSAELIDYMLELYAIAFQAHELLYKVQKVVDNLEEISLITGNIPQEVPEYEGDEDNKMSIEEILSNAFQAFEQGEYIKSLALAQKAQLALIEKSKGKKSPQFLIIIGIGIIAALVFLEGSIRHNKYNITIHVNRNTRHSQRVHIRLKGHQRIKK